MAVFGTAGDVTQHKIVFEREVMSPLMEHMHRHSRAAIVATYATHQARLQQRCDEEGCGAVYALLRWEMIADLEYS